MEVTGPTETGHHPLSSCCSTEQTSSARPCPCCGSTAPVVGAEVVHPHRPDATEGYWQYCATAGCPVVYYLDTDILTFDQLKTQVARKGLDKPTPVCFCFSHTIDDLANNLETNGGASTIKADIKTAVADGFCACEHLNPSGQCCLPDIHRALKTIQIESAELA